MNLLHWPFGPNCTGLNGAFFIFVISITSYAAGWAFHLGWNSVH